jgi:integrase
MPRHTLVATTLKAKIEAALAAAKDSQKAQKLGDGDGLMLVARPSGDASWVLRYRQDGARKDLTLGRWPTLTLKMARDEADKARKSAATGVDPVEAKKAARKARPGVASGPDTVRRLFEDWRAKEEVSAVYAGNIEAAFLKDVLPVIGAVPPEDVTREQILKILRTIEGRGAVDMVRRVRMWMRQMFEFGIEDESRPALRMSPVPMGTLKSFKKSRKKRHYAAIKDAKEVPALMKAIKGITDNFVIRNAFLLSAHTFQRPTEIREATWDEFDLDAGIWRIPAERMKLAGEHWVPLSRQVVEILRVHKGVVGDQGWLFPGRKYGQSISEGTLTGRLNNMGFEGRHTPHGFRAMARTIGEEVLHIDAKYLEKQLSHEVDVSGLRGAYNRAEYWDQRVKMMQKWSDWLDAQT